MTRFCLLLVLLAAPGALGAQDSACTYETCALRFDWGGFFSSTKLVRGSQGETFAKANRSDRLRDVLMSNDSARVHYARFEELDRTSDWLRGVGVALYLGGLVVSFRNDFRYDGLSTAMTLSGASLSVAGGVVGRRGFNRLSESVWWYNAGLARADALGPR
jgi:hypothetical protein